MKKHTPLLVPTSETSKSTSARNAVFALGVVVRMALCLVVITEFLAEDRWERHLEFGDYAEFYL